MRSRFQSIGVVASIVFALLTAPLVGNESNAVEAKWPRLETVGSVKERPATKEDMQRGHAAFMINSDRISIGVPLDIEIPQYAFQVDGDTGSRNPVVIIQAEQANGEQVVGYREVSTNTLGVGLLQEFELLGLRPPN